jgi:hypothetical protein
MANDNDRIVSRRANVLLVLGMAAGAVIAASGLATRDDRALPRDLVALVNGQPIRADEFERLLAALDGDRRDGLGEDDRRHVLDRLIDEELLLQRGLELGLVRRDRRLRAGLTGAVIASVVAEPAEHAAPREAELRAFYEANSDTAIRGDAASSLDRAAEAARRWKGGEEYAALAAALGDPPLAPLPEAPLPVSKLRDYLGPTVARAVLGLAPGEISEPIRSGGGFHVVQVVERESDSTPPFEEVRAQVSEEFRRRGDERAVRAYLDDLRAVSEILIADDAR